MSGQTTEPAQAYLSQNPGFPAKTILGTLFIGAFFGYLNETLLNVALTVIMEDFAVSRNTVQWSTTGFMLVMGAFTPITAAILQWFSARRLALFTLGLFLAGNLIAMLSPSFGWLLAGRLMQAVAAAFTVPLLMNAILRIYPPEHRGKAMGLVALVFMVAPAIGPTISGFIVDYLGWRYLFAFTMPFVLLAMALVWRYLNVELVPQTRPKIDVLSVCLSLAGFGSLVYAASSFNALSLGQFAALMAVAVALIAWFVRRQFALAEPLLDLSVFKSANFRYAITILALTYFIFLGLELLIPMYSRQVLVFSGVVAGLVMLPASIVQAVSAPLLGVLLDKKGGRAVLVPGAVIGTVSLTALWWYADAHSSALAIGLIFGVFGLAVSSGITGETVGLNALGQAQGAHGTAIINTVTPIAGSLGAAFFVGATGVGEKLSNQSVPRLAMLDGVQTAFACAALLSLVILTFAFRIKENP